MQRHLAIVGVLLPLTWRPASPTCLARAAQRVPTWAAYIAGSAALAISTGAILGPAIGVIAEPYGSVREYFDQSLSAAAFAGGWIGAIAMIAGAIAALVSFITPPRRGAVEDDVVWFGPLPHIRICLLALIPLTVPALLYSAVTFISNLNHHVLVAPPAALAWTQNLPPFLCLLFLAVPIYYAALVSMALHRLGRLESGAACIHCGYPTRGLPGGGQARCPECGQDPAEE